ncbi:MAG: TrmH family RNA methyltransferase [Bacteroidetes bacterium]|nr:MAG: TrmH family RNA methyltransferase [Bacteroidota bacterium]
MRKLQLDELGRASVEEFIQTDKTPIVVVLDNIRSAHNVGSVFRTADGFAIEKIVLTGITAQPPHREIHKTAIGATESMPWEYVENVVDAVKDLERGGYRILIAEQTDSSIPLDEISVAADDKIAIVLGNEVNGVSDEVIALFETSVEIPQFGTKHSFNVAVSTGILLWEISSKLRSV